MLGFFTTTKDDNIVVKKDKITFVSFPDDSSKEDLKIRFAKLARDFANAVNSNNVYLLYGKDDFIEYEFEI